MVDRIPVFHDQLRDRHELIPLLLQCLNQPVERFRRMFRPIVAEDDRAVSQMLVLCHFPDDRVCVIVLPVKTVIPCHISQEKFYDSIPFILNTKKAGGGDSPALILFLQLICWSWCFIRLNKICGNPHQLRIFFSKLFRINTVHIRYFI